MPTILIIGAIIIVAIIVVGLLIGDSSDGVRNNAQGNGKGWSYTPGTSNTQWADPEDFDSPPDED